MLHKPWNELSIQVSNGELYISIKQATEAAEVLEEVAAKRNGLVSEADVIETGCNVKNEVISGNTCSRI